MFVQITWHKSWRSFDTLSLTTVEHSIWFMVYGLWLWSEGKWYNLHKCARASTNIHPGNTESLKRSRIVCLRYSRFSKMNYNVLGPENWLSNTAPILCAGQTESPPNTTRKHDVHWVRCKKHTFVLKSCSPVIWRAGLIEERQAPVAHTRTNGLGLLH